MVVEVLQLMAYGQFDKIILLTIHNAREHFGTNNLDEIMILIYEVQHK